MTYYIFEMSYGSNLLVGEYYVEYPSRYREGFKRGQNVAGVLHKISQCYTEVAGYTRTGMRVVSAAITPPDRVFLNARSF